MLEKRGVYRVMVGRPDGGTTWEDPGVDGGLTLSWTFRTWDGRGRTGLIWPRTGIGDGHL